MKFSIIIPCYNVEKYIKVTVSTVLKQTYQDFELLLINDGSSDNTLSILRDLEKKDSRIRVYTQKNLGVSATRNNGMKWSLGEYILFLDGDDLIEETLLQDTNEVIKNKQVDMFSFGYDKTSGYKKEFYFSQEYHGKIFSSKQFLKYILTFKIYQSICSVVIKKDIIKHNSFDETLLIGEDLDFQLRILLNHNFKVYYSSSCYFHYIRRPNSATNKRELSFKHFNTLDSLNILRESMKRENIEEYKIYHIVRFFHILIGISNCKCKKGDHDLILEKIKKYSYILHDLKFSWKRQLFLLNILKGAYFMNIRCVLFLFKIKKILGIKYKN